MVTTWKGTRVFGGSRGAVVVLLVLACVFFAGYSRADEVADLIEKLKDSDPKVRVQAAWALGKIGDARAVEPLSAALKDSHEDVREEAAEALEKIKNARAKP